MNSELQKRLYEIEVMPPAALWEKLSLSIDEINADNFISTRILEAEFTPPLKAWENISIAIGAEEKKEPARKGTVINFRRLAMAALFIGLVVTAWILFRPNSQTSAGLVDVPTEVKKPTTNTNTNAGTVDPKKEDNSSVIASVASPTPQTFATKKRNNNAIRHNDIITAQLVTEGSPSLNNELAARSFDKPIDDLSLVTSDQHYMTMVNANGRLVKIPAELAHLAPHLQDKPISEDYYEVMFGEGAYWKETLSEWRKKIASVPVSSGDAFTSLIELLKSVQDK
jgi:hypothetical protein